MILDASATVDALIGTRRAAAVLAQMRRAPFLAAPGLLYVEVSSALWRLQRTGELAGDVVEACHRDLLDLRIQSIDHRPLLPVAWPLRESVRLADAFYLAAARVFDVPLLTTDGRLARAHHGARVVHVA